MEVLRGHVVGRVLLQFTKAGQSGALCCQRGMDFWASFSRVSKSSASYLLLTGPGPASSTGQVRKSVIFKHRKSKLNPTLSHF